MEKIEKTLEKKQKTSEKPRRKQSSIKWVCPECGFIIRSTRPDTYVYCGCSMKRFIKEKKGGDKV